MSAEPLAKPPWREVALSERRENTNRSSRSADKGHHWIITLSCGHVTVWSERRLQLVPRKMRCQVCQGAVG